MAVIIAERLRICSQNRRADRVTRKYQAMRDNSPPA